MFCDQNNDVKNNIFKSLNFESKSDENTLQFKFDNKLWNIKISVHSQAELPFLRYLKASEATAYIGLFRYTKDLQYFNHMVFIIQEFYLNKEKSGINTNLPLIILQFSEAEDVNFDFWKTILNKEYSNVFDRFPIKKFYNVVVRNDTQYLRDVIVKICAKLNRILINITKHQNIYQDKFQLLFNTLIDKYSPLCVDKNGMNLLHHLTLMNNLDIIKNLNNDLVQKLCEQQDYMENTPLHYAASNKEFVDIFHFLLEKSSGEIENSYHESPFFVAIRNNNTKLISDLINQLANTRIKKIVNYINTDDVTSSQYAILKNSMESLKEMFTKSKIFFSKQRNNKGETALLYSIRTKNNNVLKELIRLYNKDEFFEKTNRNETALHYACLWDNSYAFNCFKNYTLMYTKDSDNNFPIHIAAKKGEAQFVEELIKNSQSSLSNENIHKETPLFCAVQGNHEDVIKIILNNLEYTQSLYNDFDANGFLPIHYFVKYDSDIQKFQNIIDKYKKDDIIDKTTKQHQSLLMIAIQFKRIQMIFTILKYKPNLEQRDDSNNNVLDYALSDDLLSPLVFLLIESGLSCNDNKCLEKYQYFLNKFKKGWNCLHEVIFSHCNKSIMMKNIIDLCIEKTNYINYFDMQYLDSFTPIHIAFWNCPDNVLALLHCSNNLFVESYDGWSYLFYAVKYNLNHCTKYLLEQGLDPNHVDLNGWSPLHIALINQNAEIANRLIEKNADITITTYDNISPIDIAFTFFPSFMENLEKHTN